MKWVMRSAEKRFLAEMAVMLRDQGNHGDALTLLRGLEPHLVQREWALTHIGTVAQAQGRYTDAETAYGEAIEFNPQYGLAHAYLGELLIALGREAEAIAALSRARELDPEGTGAWVERVLDSLARGTHT